MIFSEIHKKHLSEAHKGENYSNKGEFQKGHPVPKEWGEKNGAAHRGEKNWNWRGGITSNRSNYRKLLRINNLERYRQYARKWRSGHKIEKRIDTISGRVLRLGLKGNFTKNQWQEKLELNNFSCVICKEKNKLTFDHIIPAKRWKEWIETHPEVKYDYNDIENLQPLCLSCNCSKGDRIHGRE